VIEARDTITEQGLYLAFREGEDVRIVPLTREWTASAAASRPMCGSTTPPSPAATP